MIKDIERNGADKGRGQPEALKHELTGYYRRRIDSANRLVYKVDGDKLNIVQCGTPGKIT
ncbi:MAG: type II toxin-antitoxin system YoeB family toxin [Treponemataceae bacterium]|nr:type II toxin-antitoxin system YoeB family toxin [Treponemataceae bacterium]